MARLTWFLRRRTTGAGPATPIRLLRFCVWIGAGVLLAVTARAQAETTARPILQGKHWVAVTGKPLAAAAGASTFARGGNAVDAACAMLAAVATIWDTMSWGGETVGLIYDPGAGIVHGIDAVGYAPTGATPRFFAERGLPFPPAVGPLAAVTPGTPGGLMIMLAEYGSMSLEQVLAPALELAEGFPVDTDLAESIEQRKRLLASWPSSRDLFLTHYDERNPDRWAAPLPGEIFRQPDLHATLLKLIEAERRALAAGSNRRESILAAYERFYRGDIAAEFVAAAQEAGGLVTLDDLARWQVRIEQPAMTTYKGYEVYKPTQTSQGPVLLQTLNILENMDLRAMGYNTPRYIHALYQAMNLAFADRDFYYGDAEQPPMEPMTGLLSKAYARERFATIDWQHNAADVKPGDPYAAQGLANPYAGLLQSWPPLLRDPDGLLRREQARAAQADADFRAGTTSIQAVDSNGWVVSLTPSGAWIPTVIAGRTGFGMSQRMQSFVLEAAQGPFNVVAPGKRPRTTLTPTLVLRNGRPFLAFSQQGGDSQDQNLLQFFLNVVEFRMDIQQAAEAANFNSYQMHASFGDHRSEPGRLVLRADTAVQTRLDLAAQGYRIETWPRTSGPTTAIMIDPVYGSLWGAASDFGEDYGIAW
jgi:gamma-glutamyltranspeptidase/glutathione hydrolase